MMWVTNSSIDSRDNGQLQHRLKRYWPQEASISALLGKERIDFARFSESMTITDRYLLCRGRK